MTEFVSIHNTDSDTTSHIRLSAIQYIEEDSGTLVGSSVHFEGGQSCDLTDEQVKLLLNCIKPRDLSAEAEPKNRIDAMSEEEKLNYSDQLRTDEIARQRQKM